MNKTFEIRDAIPSDQEALLALLPQLADFDLPAHRNPDDLWKSDAKLMEQHLAGKSDNTILLVAADEAGKVAGFALTSQRPELLSGESSAHLEAIVVAGSARGCGLGRRLLELTEQRSVAAGAKSITLHAFAANTRATSLYESAGFDGELVRYSKLL